MDLLELCARVPLVLKKKANTNGGEYSSSCPACGGQDRFIIWPKEARKNCTGSYWCRNCGAKGDAIEFCVQFLGMSYQDALSLAGVSLQKEDIVLLSKRMREGLDNRKPLTPEEAWIKSAEAVVKDAEREILRTPEVLAYLEKRGIGMAVVKTFRLGYRRESQNVMRKTWGLDQELDDKTLYLPSGIVIPSTDDKDRVVKLKMRTFPLEEGRPKYMCVGGSARSMSKHGNRQARVVMVVESELDAITLASYAGHACLFIATGSSAAIPDLLTEYYCERCSRLLIAYDRDDAGRKMCSKWIDQYPQSIPAAVPGGKDVGEAIANGVDVKKWLLEKIKLPLAQKAPFDLEQIMQLVGV